jgi:ribonuclease HI
MPWREAVFKDKAVWVEVDPGGQPVVDGGRVAMRYSKADGAKLYWGGLANLNLGGGGTIELPPGVAADAAPAAGAAAKKGGRGSGFGKAGTRSAAQSTAAKAAGRELIDGFAKDAAVCFTDGACKGNPGPAGAGAVVRLPDGRHLERFKALGQATNNVGELAAIGLALDLLDEAGWPITAAVEILSDSDYANGVLTRGWKAKANVELIAGLKLRLKGRKNRVHWIAGHVGIAENERADALANMGVDESRRR